MIYLDSSALAKLWREEAESAALRRWWADDRELAISSRLAAIEVERLLRRERAPGTVMADAEQVLRAVATLPLDDHAQTAARLEPADMRSLDALHLATAIALGRALNGLCTYDDRLAAAARHHGIATLAPGRP